MALAALLIAMWSYGAFSAGLSEPWNYGSDALLQAANVHTVVETGFYGHDPQFGAPFGQDNQDFPQISSTGPDVWLIKGLAVFASGTFTVVNAYLLLTFALCALSAFLVLRAFAIRRPSAAVFAVLFAIAPYHFQRGTFHLFLSAYYTVPLIAYLALRVSAAEPLIDGVRSRRTLLTAAVAFLVGAGSVYYAVFGLLLIAGAVLLAGRAAVRTGVIVLAVMAAGLVFSQLPTIVFRAQHGGNPAAASRSPAASESFGLKLDQLLYPIPEHRIHALGREGHQLIFEAGVPSEYGGQLGIVGVVGLGWLVVAGLIGLVRTGPLSALERRASALTLIAILIATVGGLSGVIAFLVTPQIRAWSRMSIVIAFLALLAVALLVARLEHRRRLHAAVLAAVLVAGVFDQTAPAFKPDHPYIHTLYARDAGLVHGVERLLGHGSMLLELPYLDYPDSTRFWPPGDYEPVKPALLSSLRGTYGAIRGRPADWLATMDSVPLRPLVDGAAASGFAGVWVDRRAYPDAGAALLGALEDRLGPPIAGDDQIAVFDLRPLARKLTQHRGTAGIAAMRAATVRPVRSRVDPDGTLVLDNPGPGRRTVRVGTVAPGTVRLDPGITRIPSPGGDPVVVGVELCRGLGPACTAGPRPQVR